MLIILYWQSKSLWISNSCILAKVVAKVVKEGKAKKVLVFRYKNKTNHDILRGHRQPYTRVKIEEIVA